MLLYHCAAFKAQYLETDLGEDDSVSQNLTIKNHDVEKAVRCAGICTLDELCFGFFMDLQNKCSTLLCTRPDKVQAKVPEVLYVEPEFDSAESTLLARGTYKITFDGIIVLFVCISAVKRSSM